jgi:PKD repeat protein
VNEAITFNNTSSGSAGFSWNFGDGSTSTLSNPSHSYAAAGTYTVTLAGSSTTYGCVDSITQTVVVNALPVPVIAADQIFGCGPLSVNFSNTSLNANFYSWNFDDGNLSSSAAPSHTFTSTGIYNVVMIAENLQGCIDSTSISINVYPSPTSAFNLSSTFACSLPATAVLSNTSTGADSYAWDFGDGTSSALSTPALSYPGYGNYNITLIATNTYGCSDTTSQIFHASQTPIVSFGPASISGCQPLTVSFTNASQFANNYLWTFGNGDTSTSATPTYVYTAAGNFNVTLTASNLYCSSSDNSGVVIVHPKPTAAFDYTQVYVDDTPNGTISFENLSGGAGAYSWQFGDGEGTTESDPTHQFPGVGPYVTTLIVANQYMCADTAYMTVTPDYFQSLFIPNALFPGNPAGGESTLFLPKGKSLKAYHLQIFDTWGISIFETSLLDVNGSPAEGWDGTKNGVPCPQDVYVWKIDAIFMDGTIWQGKEYSGGTLNKTGTVTLIK